MYRANRGYPTGPAGGFMGHEPLEDTNQEMEGELKELMSHISSGILFLVHELADLFLCA